MDAFARLDEEKGALRILNFLYFPLGLIQRQLLINAMKGMGVGRTAFYRSLDCLKELGLVEEVPGDADLGKGVFTKLSPRGYVVAEKLREFQQLLHTSMTEEPSASRPSEA
jgi:DNA-binding MarR family transcriptional regulator